MERIEEENLSTLGKLILPFKKFKHVFNAAGVFGKIAMLVQVILLGFGPLVLGQVELGLVFVAVLYGLGFGFGYITTGFTNHTLPIDTSAYVVVAVIFIVAIIVMWYVTFSKTIKLVEELNKGESTFNSVVFNFVYKIGTSVRNWFKDFAIQFKVGDKKVKTLLPLSFFSFGIPLIAFGEVIKGLALFLVQALCILFMIARGAGDLINFITLGQRIIPPVTSQQILIYGVIALFVVGLFIFFYIVSLNQTLKAAREHNEKRLGPDFKKQLYNLVDKNFYVTSLIIPVLGALVFTIIPIVFMIFIAFTNFSNKVVDNYSTTVKDHVLNWVGFDTFKRVFSESANLADFLSVFAWTMIWALLATFTCFFGGLLLAMLINKKSIKFKAVFRSLFVVSMAMPQFVSLLTMRTFFSGSGALEAIFRQWGFMNSNAPFYQWLNDLGLLTAQGHLDFWNNEFVSKMLIIFINMWVGIPYYMLLMSGLLINIPKGYYEAAKISGASKWQQFTRITFPNIMFMTAPMLITSFVSNITNFNVIWFLTKGEPSATSVSSVAGKTDILITWLYKLTMGSNNQDYNFGAAIGIVMFIVMATLSLIVFRNTSSYKNEEEYR